MYVSIAHADGDAYSMLDRMGQSFRSLNYQGMFTYQQGQQLSSVRVVHAVVDGKEHARVVALDGNAREVLWRGHALDCMHTGNLLLRSDVALDASLPVGDAMPAGLAGYYTVERDGIERVAGRPGSRVRVSPRDPYRYGMTLVVDDATSLLLKSETTDEAGRVLERFQFVSVDIGGGVSSGELKAETGSPRVFEEQGHQRPDEQGQIHGRSEPSNGPSPGCPRGLR